MPRRAIPKRLRRISQSDSIIWVTPKCKGKGVVVVVAAENFEKKKS